MKKKFSLLNNYQCRISQKYSHLDICSRPGGNPIYAGNFVLKKAKLILNSLTVNYLIQIEYFDPNCSKIPSMNLRLI